MSSEPVDWVQKRVDCRIEILFERLFSQMKRDVEAFRKTSRGGTFTISPSLVEDLDATVVVRDSNALRRSGVQVTLTDDHRLTVRRDDEEQFITLKWDEDEATCHLCIDNQALPMWKISCRILYPLFFGVSPGTG